MHKDEAYGFMFDTRSGTGLQRISMLLAQSSVAAAKRDSLIALYGPFAAALLLLIVIASSPSSGIHGIQQSSDEDNADGPGDTGFKPFLGLNTESDLQVVSDPRSAVTPLTADIAIPDDSRQPRLLSPVAPLAIVMRQDMVTSDSNDIHIQEAIQRDLDTNALLLSHDRNSGGTNDEAKDEIQDSVAATDIAQPHERDRQNDQAASDQTFQPEAELPGLAEAEGAAPDNNDAGDETTTVTWGQLLDSLASRNTGPQELAAAQSLADGRTDSTDNRVQRPDRIQRPVLPPPRQTLSIRRAGLLPPPIRPLIP